MASLVGTDDSGNDSDLSSTSKPVPLQKFRNSQNKKSLKLSTETFVLNSGLCAMRSLHLPVSNTDFLRLH